MKPKRPKKKPIKGRSYASRNYILKMLGFASYKEYLASDLWKSVRKKVYAAKGKNCYLCGKPATELHHNRYHKNDLIGKKLKYIHPICRGCHEDIEFRAGEKTTLNQAKITFNKRRRMFNAVTRESRLSDESVLGLGRTMPSPQEVARAFRDAEDDLRTHSPPPSPRTDS